jgi:hypothetical protein
MLLDAGRTELFPIAENVNVHVRKEMCAHNECSSSCSCSCNSMSCIVLCFVAVASHSMCKMLQLVCKMLSSCRASFDCTLIGMLLKRLGGIYVYSVSWALKLQKRGCELSA